MPTYDNLPKISQHFKGKWFDKMVEDLQLAGKAKRTVYGYVREVRKLADFHQKSPAKITENEVRSYLLHQIIDQEVASGSQSVTLSGIKFFYRTTCPRKWKVLDQTKVNYGSALRRRTLPSPMHCESLPPVTSPSIANVCHLITARCWD